METGDGDGNCCLSVQTGTGAAVETGSLWRLFYKYMPLTLTW